MKNCRLNVEAFRRAILYHGSDQLTACRPAPHLRMTVTLEDFHALAEADLREFDESRTSTGLPTVEAAKLESQVLQLYRLTVLAVRREESDDAAAQLWRNMVRLCDDACLRLSRVQDENPGCRVSHDRLLELRAKCARLADLHA